MIALCLLASTLIGIHAIVSPALPATIQHCDAPTALPPLTRIITVSL